MRKGSYLEFSQRLERLALRKAIPLRVCFELTYNCNFNCRHCYVPKAYQREYRKKELKTEEVFFILRQLKQAGGFYLGFTGGEPFLRRDILRILDFAKRCGFQIIINTNGSLLEKKTVSYLANLGINKLDITLPALTRVAFQRITGAGEKERKQLFRAIEFLTKNKVNFSLKSCLLKENEPQMPRIRDFARSLGVRHRLDDRFFPRLDGSEQPYKYRAKPAVKNGLCRLKNRRVKFSTEECPEASGNKGSRELFFCGAGLTQAAITPAGELKLCLMIDYPRYKIRESSFAECWSRLKKFVQSIKIGKDYKCQDCSLRPYCKSCPAISWLKARDFFSCDTESKLWAESERCLYEN